MTFNSNDMNIFSPDVEPGADLSKHFTTDGDNVPPELDVSGIPEGTVELVLIMHDPDAPLANGFTHWVVYGLPPRAGRLNAEAGRIGPNGAGMPEYTGPEPPVGHGIHHYYFHVYALAVRTEAAPTREEFLAKYGQHVIAQSRLVCLYQR